MWRYFARRKQSRDEKWLSGRFPEKVNFCPKIIFDGLMGESSCVALKSASEDFEGTTLGAVPGLLAKLCYIASLHDGQGDYIHWGMARTYGEETARRAIRAAHAGVLSQVLRTPLHRLDEDLRRSAASRQVTDRELLLSLTKRTHHALPEQSGVPAEKHFRVVLHALSALVENRAHASHPNALPPQLPGQ